MSNFTVLTDAEYSKLRGEPNARLGDSKYAGNTTGDIASWLKGCIAGLFNRGEERRNDGLLYDDIVKLIDELAKRGAT